jgi:hypothetical protein
LRNVLDGKLGLAECMVGQTGRNSKAPADQLPGMENVINRPPSVRGHAFYCRY